MVEATGGRQVARQVLPRLRADPGPDRETTGVGDERQIVVPIVIDIAQGDARAPTPGRQG